MINLVITGAAGRMGRRIAAIASEDGEIKIVGAVEAPGHEGLGADLGELAGIGSLGVPVSEDFEGDCDVMIDFSLPDSTMNWVEVCRTQGIPMVIGTTGFSEDDEQAIADVARAIPMVFSGNYSMGINLLCKLVTEAAKALGESYDIEVVETHHRFKQDAPSGTAKMLARSACEALGKEYRDAAVHGRQGAQPRQAGEIGIHAVRLGDTVGEHSVHFGNLGETVRLSHSAHSRDTFVRGAVRAAKWLVGKEPGLYTMRDVLEL